MLKQQELDYFMVSLLVMKIEMLKICFVSTFVHPKEAVDNSMRVFGINEKEKDIIKSHMFPINISLPKYAESWIVSMVDKVVGSYEFGRKFGYLVNVYLILLLNIKL